MHNCIYYRFVFLITYTCTESLCVLRNSRWLITYFHLINEYNVSHFPLLDCRCLCIYEKFRETWNARNVEKYTHSISKAKYLLVTTLEDEINFSLGFNYLY